MSLRKRVFWTLLGLLLCFAATARADRKPPVKVELLGEPRAAVAGEAFAGRLRITSGKAAELTEFRLEGEGWRQLRLDVPAIASLAKGEELVVDFTALPTDPGQWLVVHFLWNGIPFAKHLDLSPAALRWVDRDVSVKDVPGGQDDIFPMASRLERPEPVISAEAAAAQEKRDESGDAGEEPGAVGAAKLEVRVRGRFVYDRHPTSDVIGAYGLTVEIWDEDTMVDDYLGSTTTGADGRFDITVSFSDSWETYPDIYVKFRSVNAEHEIHHATWGNTWAWVTGVTSDVSSYLNIGTIRSGDESLEAALHIFTDVTRTWRWSYIKGYDPHYVEVEWPDGDEGAWYQDWNEEIHISSGSQWRDGTMSHEYGHHWINSFSVLGDPDYCNDYCDDDPPWDCGHCLWCEENNHDAWDEGFADYFGYVIPLEYGTLYGLDAWSKTEVGGLDTCDADHRIHDALITEGFVASCLADIQDDTVDNHPICGSWYDRVALGPLAILDAVHETHPSTFMPFLLEMKSRFGSEHEELWETGMNCGFDIDTENPGAPPSVWSTTHSTGIPSPAAIARFQWTPADDDASGVDRYCVRITEGAPALPSSGSYVEGERRWESGVLDPGVYYFNVRAIDRAGNWSSTYAYYGPFEVREPYPADIEFELLPGWDYPLVVTSSNSSSHASAVVPATLPGETGSTYWNIAGRNAGESDTAENVYVSFNMDGHEVSTYNFGTVSHETSFYAVNRGPFSFRGGRHTVYCILDYPGVIAEVDEYDNEWGHQFVWTPLQLSPSDIQSRYVPRNMLSGWEHVHDGSLCFYNCDGLRFDNSGWWNAVVAWTENNDYNVDMLMHLASTGAQNGFTASLESSYRAPGCLEAVIVNRNSVATAQYDVGIINPGTSITEHYKVVHLENDWVDFDDPVTVPTGPDQWLYLYEVSVLAENVGPVSVVITTSPPTGDVHVQWRDYDYVHGGLMDCAAQATTDAEGRAILQHDVAVAGYHSVLVYRDPKDGDQVVDVTIHVRQTPPDFEPYWAQGWHSPFVPRPADDGTPSSVSLPDTLYGNVASTYLNLAIQNNSPAPAESLRVNIYRDETSVGWLLYMTFAGWGTSRVNWGYAHTVPGGRHTLFYIIDRYNEITELDEYNNFYGEQYCWSPEVLMPGGTTVRMGPPERTTGWQFVGSGEPLWYNCDGVRMRNLTTYWAGLAVMPGDTSNVDIRLHQPLTGAKDGFAANLAYSGWGDKQSDFLILNFNVLAHQNFDVGVLQIKGTQPYAAHCVHEIWFPSPAGPHGPFTMENGQILQLYEMYLEPGPYAYYLEDVDHNVDWGFSLHPADEGYISKSMVVEGGMSWMRGVGQDETFGVDVPAAGYYCLAVWKVNHYDLAKTGNYRIQIEAGISGVGDQSDLPQVTTLRGVYPNPFNPQTTVAFDLATPAGVDVAVYDLAGARVRTLVREQRPAGRHTVVWDGRDEAGRQVASGVYVARMVAGEIRALRKMVLVK